MSPQILTIETWRGPTQIEHDVISLLIRLRCWVLVSILGIQTAMIFL